MKITTRFNFNKKQMAEYNRQAKLSTQASWNIIDLDSMIKLGFRCCQCVHLSGCGSMAHCSMLNIDIQTDLESLCHHFEINNSSNFQLF